MQSLAAGCREPPPRHAVRPPTMLPATFPDADSAWLWTMAAIVARREASPRGVDGCGPPRTALPDDVIRCLDQLYRARRIDLSHARVLRRWGERGRRPSPGSTRERCDAAVWDEAMERLRWPLQRKGIVARPAH